MTQRALIAMSGGVDSSVAACLIQEQGFEGIGVTMQLYKKEEKEAAPEKGCGSWSEAEDARRIAAAITQDHPDLAADLIARWFPQYLDQEDQGS